MQQILFDPFGKERTLERIGGPGNQHQNVEQRKGHRNAPRPHTRNADRIGQSAYQVNDKCENTNDG